MRSPEKLVVSVLCLGLMIGVPAVLAQAIPKTLLRLCLRNVATGIACYIVGRGGELIVDGSLSAAWAKAKETVTGEDGGGAPDPKPPPAKRPALPNAIVEPLSPAELGALSKRVPGSASKRLLTEGFVIYDRPHGLSPGASNPPESLVPKAPAGTSAAPRPNLSDLVRPQTSSPGLLWPKLAAPKPTAPKYGEPLAGSDPYLAPNAGSPAPSTSPLAAARLGAQQSECQRRRERESGLSFLAIFGAADFDAKLKRRMEEVVKPCIRPGLY
jgi:hypothetical protein